MRFKFARFYGRNFVKVGLLTGVVVYLLLRVFSSGPSGDMALGFQWYFHLLVSLFSMFVATSVYSIYRKDEYEEK